MLNSIVLSSDMETLYFIDNGRSIEFPLDKRGVVIGLIEGQLAVATAIKVLTPIEDETDDSQAAEKALAPQPDPLFPKLLKLPLEKSQWSLSFRPQEGYLFAIGATDIEFERPDAPMVTPKTHIFKLDEGVIRMYKIENNLNFVFLKRDF